MPIVAETSRRFLSRGIEIAANVATLVVAVLLSVVLVKNYLLPTSSSRLVSASVRPADLITTGTNLNRQLSGIKWDKNSRTVVLALSTHCHFCTESAPFFRHIKESIGKDVKLVGVLPEPVAEAESYLSREGVHLDKVRQVSLNKVGVTGTPTMLLVNRDGIVMQTWVGKLPPDEQEEALNVILGGRSGGTSPKTSAVSEARP